MQTYESIYVIPGGRAGTLLLEQRIHNVSNGGEQSRDHADHVPGAVSDQQGALEPDHRGARLQRAQDLHGDELQALR